MPSAISEQVGTVISDPRWLPHRLDAGSNLIRFVRLEREDHRSVTFLDDKYFRNRFPMIAVPINEAVAAATQLSAPAAPLHFIFHSAMALSTLAARLFDQPGLSMALKEPVILNEVAALKRSGRPVRPILHLLCRLLARSFSAGEPVVVKPGNVANTLIPDLLATRPESRALILYSPLPVFLRSIAKRGMWGRVAYRRLFAMLRRDRFVDFGYSNEELFEQSDLQIVALAWLQHQAQFAALPALFPKRLIVLDSETFLTEARGSLTAIARHFGISPDVEALLSGPTFREHSKELGRAFNANDRDHEQRRVEELYGEELHMVSAWAEQVATTFRIPLTLEARRIA